MEEYLKSLCEVFESNRNSKVASEQKAYLRNQFEFLGIKTTPRRALQKPFLVKGSLPDKQDLAAIVIQLWNKPEREFHYFGQELARKYINQWNEDDIDLFEYMITHRSWWDTVDIISAHLLGNYFKLFPKQIKPVTDRWIEGGHLWLQRSTLLFQLRYKNTLDKDLLVSIIKRLQLENDFFIKKAIGWILREYGKVNPDWVLRYVSTTDLSKLSEREALKNLRPKD
jgi:3-methyladenine DNA glycosylase AlkD